MNLAGNFSGEVWINLRIERPTTLMTYLRKLLKAIEFMQMKELPPKALSSQKAAHGPSRVHIWFVQLFCANSVVARNNCARFLLELVGWAGQFLCCLFLSNIIWCQHEPVAWNMSEIFQGFWQVNSSASGPKPRV